jgi:hypothetical protein
MLIHQLGIGKENNNYYKSLDELTKGFFDGLTSYDKVIRSRKGKKIKSNCNL